MKRNALVAFGLLLSLVSASAVMGKEVRNVSNFSVSNQANITAEQAKKIALKRVEGTVEDEYTIEDEDEKVTTYVFVIKNKAGKIFEVQIDAKDGKVLSVDEQTEEAEDTEDPPANDVESTETEEVESTEAPEVESTEAPEVESTEAPEANVSDENETVEAPMKADDDAPAFKVTMEQARVKANKKVKGEIQSEALVTDQGNAYYAFMIKGKKNTVTEVRVDAISGKATKLKAAKSE
jgi:uncharacterized membrane protein YkoI